MEEKCEIELTEGYHSINSRDVRLHIHKGKNAWVVRKCVGWTIFGDMFYFRPIKCG